MNDTSTIFTVYTLHPSGAWGMDFHYSQLKAEESGARWVQVFPDAIVMLMSPVLSADVLAVLKAGDDE